jgi:hypothetical protein
MKVFCSSLYGEGDLGNHPLPFRNARPRGVYFLKNSDTPVDNLCKVLIYNIKNSHYYKVIVKNGRKSGV